MVRFVVLDSETTGLDPRKDLLITIGAVAVVGGEILLDGVFDALLEVKYNSAAVTVHGVTRQESLGGVTEPEALKRFLAHLKDGVIVGLRASPRAYDKLSPDPDGVKPPRPEA